MCLYSIAIWTVSHCFRGICHVLFALDKPNYARVIPFRYQENDKINLVTKAVVLEKIK